MSSDGPSREEFNEMKVRLRKMEDYIFAAKILSALLAIIAAGVAWIAQNWAYIKDLILHLLGAR